MMTNREISRRELLATGLAGAALTASGRAFALPAAGGARLLVVFLRGAYDAANIVVPVSSDFYYQARPTIAIARPDAANMATHAEATFWYVLPSLPMFLAIPFLLRHGVGFWAALLAGCVLTVALYLATIRVAASFGLKL